MGTLLVLLIVIFACLAFELPVYFLRFMPKKCRLPGIDTLVNRILAIFINSARAYMHVDFLHDKGDFSLPERFIIVSNHQSLLDIPVLMDFFKGICKVRFVSKRELGSGIPFISTVLRLQEHALIDRKGRMSSSMRTLATFAEVCGKRGTCPLIFPEGTRSKDGKVRTFHSAGFRRILDVQPLPVVFVAIEGGWKFTSLKKLVLSLERVVYRIKIVGIGADAGLNKNTVNEVLERGRKKIEETITDWRAGY